MEPIETSISGANHADFFAQNDRRGGIHRDLYAGPQVAVLHTKPPMRAGTNTEL